MTDRTQFVLNPLSNNLPWFWKIDKMKKCDVKRIIDINRHYIFRIHLQRQKLTRPLRSHDGRPGARKDTRWSRNTTVRLRSPPPVRARPFKVRRKRIMAKILHHTLRRWSGCGKSQEAMIPLLIQWPKKTIAKLWQHCYYLTR